MSDKKIKHWLILSYCSNIDGSACAQHLDDRLPYFRQRGIHPILLSGPTGLRQSAVLHERTPSVAPSGIRFELRHILRKSISQKWLFKVIETILLIPVLPFYLIEKILLDIESEWSWFFLASRRGYLLSKKYPPEVIYSTGGSASAHLAAFFVARKTRVPWIAEFQDPLVHEDWPRGHRALKIFKWLERFICRHASAVVFLTQSAMENAKQRTELGDRGHFVYPGSRSKILPDVEYKKEGGVCHFAHFGSLSGSRNPEIFLKSLRLLLDDEPSMRDIVKVDFYGSMDRNSRICIENFPYNNVVSDQGKISRKASLEIMMQSDCLLLIQNTEAFSKETIPSKVYEYLHSGRPIIGLVYQNKELSEMLKGSGHFVANADDVDGVCTVIKKFVGQFRKDAFLLREGGVHKWETKTAVDKLIELQKQLQLAL